MHLLSYGLNCVLETVPTHVMKWIVKCPDRFKTGQLVLSKPHVMAYIICINHTHKVLAFFYVIL